MQSKKLIFAITFSKSPPYLIKTRCDPFHLSKRQLITWRMFSASSVGAAASSQFLTESRAKEIATIRLSLESEVSKNLLKICQNRLQFFGPLHEATPSPSCRCRPVKFYVWYVILESRIAWERWRVWEILIWPRSSHLHFFSSQRFLAAGIFL